jgi:UDP-2-acetamido-2-deoxy-ribo-hexuluronate aminotransferase
VTGKFNKKIPMDIKMVDLHSQYLRIKPEIDQAIQSVLDSTAFIAGKDVTIFADSLSQFLDTKVVTCANGTDALQIAMMALGYRPGDEIILPVHTYVATAEVIALLGLTPVFVDVDADNFNIDINKIEEKISPRTKAIVPVHLYGQCADMESLLQIAHRHNLHIIEDAAQSLGAIYTFRDGKKVRGGTMGIIGTTSFFPSKNLGCFGDGGAMMTCDEALFQTLRMMANHGQRIKYHHDVIGVNSRLDTLQAAILSVKLKYLNEYEQKRNDVASFYDKNLSGVAGIQTPARVPYSTHVFHQYTLKVDEPHRDKLKAELEKRGIPTMIYYPVPLHLQNAYRRQGIDEGAFPVTEKLSRTVISLPIHTEMTTDQLEYICATIKNYF